MTMGTQQQALVAGAIEAAEIVSTRKVRDSEDRLTDHIHGVREFALGLDSSIQALKAATVVLAESYDHMPALLRADLAVAVEGVHAALAEVALDATTKGVGAAAQALQADLQRQVRGLSEQLLEHLTGLHEAAVANQDRAAGEAVRGMMGHLSQLSRELARGAREELTQVAKERLDAADAALEERLAAGRTVESELQEVAARVARDYEALQDEVREAVDMHQTILKDSISEAWGDLETRAVTDLNASLSEQLDRVFSEQAAALEQDRAALHDEIRTAATLTQEETQTECKALVQEKLAAIPAPEQGPAGPPGPPGVVGRVVAWQPERLHSKGTCVSHFGGIWQARANTEEEPGHSVDWDVISQGVESALLSAEGNLLLRMSDGQRVDVGNVRGPQGPGWEHKGVYAKDEVYSELDVVILRGTSYVAVQDDPGECPGPGWRMVAQAKAGPAGKPGKPGRKGDPGPPGPIGPPGVVPPWRGRYALGEEYSAGESVHYRGSAWIALQSGRLDPPKADGEQWDLMVHGVSGSQGGGSGQAVTSLSGDLRMVKVTQAEYDALSPPDERVLYLICG